MPRENPGRAMRREDDVRRRIQHEREARVWSYDRMATRMGEVGCPMQATAVHKMEKGRPPRRITVEELHGFAAAFEVPAAELLVPVEVAQDEELRAHLATLAETRRELRRLIRDSWSQERAVADHVYRHGYTQARMRAVEEAAQVMPDLYGDEAADERLTSSLNLHGVVLGMSTLENPDGHEESWGAPARGTPDGDAFYSQWRADA